MDLHFMEALLLLFIVIAIGFAVAAVRRWMIGHKQNNAQKRMGALKSFTLACALIALAVIIGTFLSEFLSR